MIVWFLNEKEINLISLSEKYNNEELVNWKIPNFSLPLIIIGISLFAYIVLLPSEVKNFKDFFNLVLNGSIPMVAFTRASSALSYLSKMDFKESEKLGVNLKNLRLKISIYIISLVSFIIILYCFQVIYKPFDFSFFTLLQFILSLILFFISLSATKATFLLQEAFLLNTYLLSFKKNQESLNKEIKDDEISF